MLKDKDWSK